MSTDMPEVTHIFRTYRVLPDSPRFDTWCVFFKVDGKLTYWLMDNMDEASKVHDELQVWQRFRDEWANAKYARYKRSVVMGRNMDDARAKLDMFLIRQNKGDLTSP